MNDPNELYRQARQAQREAEEGGFINTATALAAIAEMLLQETQVDDAVIQKLSGKRFVPPPGALPIHRRTRH